MIESVGTVRAIYTVEQHPEDGQKAVVTYWLENGARIGQIEVLRGEPGGAQRAPEPAGRRAE